MKQHRPNPSDSRRAPVVLASATRADVHPTDAHGESATRAGLSIALALPLALGFLGACGGGSGDRVSESGFQPGTVQDNPDAGAASRQFLVDSNSGGRAVDVRLLQVLWGRLVDVEDGGGTITARDLVVSQNDLTGPFVYTRNPITEKTTVRILHPAGTPEYDSAFITLADDSNLTLVADAGLNPVLAIPFIARNGALLLRFSDVLDPDTIDNLTVRVLTGYPPITPFLARVVPDPNHGDLADYDGQPGLEYYPTRVVVDSTVSTAEAQGTSLLVNSLGFPASLTLGQANVQVRVPTKTSAEANQTQVLRNLTGHAITTSGSGTYDANSTTRDVVRSLRSGGPSDLTNDPSNGFLPDDDRPSVIGTQPVAIGGTIEAIGAGVYRTSLDYAFGACSGPLRAGDVIQQFVGGCVVFAEVVCPPGLVCGPDDAATGGVVGSTLTDVYFRYVATGDGACSSQTFQAGGVAQIELRYSATLHASQKACFISFSPAPGLPPAASIAPDAAVSVRFSEPMDPASLLAFDSFFVTRVETAPVYNQYVIGRVTSSSDLRTFTFRPTLPLRHAQNTSETYFMNLLTTVGAQEGARDLAGNPLVETIGAVPFMLDATALTQATDGFAFRFDSSDMIPGDGNTSDPGFDKDEWRGQFLIDGLRQIVTPRPVSRIQVAADRTQAVPSIMAPFTTGVQTPISRYGSKLQTLWRYCDVGFSLLDEQFYNIDIEHLYWGPAGGQVIADTIPRLEIGLTHSGRLPDESLDPNLLPQWPASGLVATYTSNVLDPANDPNVTVHPGAFGQPGYVIQPVNASVTSTGTVVMAWPLNMGISTDKFSYFTWRNTAVLAKGGPSGPGAELQIVTLVTGTGTQGQPYAASAVPTVGLPLLMEFRCYPNDAITGQNAFDISLATASSAQPNFRAFSTGGFNTSGLAVTKNPDLQTVATGGFNPTSTPTPGATTPGVDNSFYIGAIDLVVRVNRMHSIWFDTGFAGVRYQEPVIEPPVNEQPEGTQVQLAFRGATTVTNTNIKTDATTIDVYGEAVANPAPTFFQNDRTWKSSMAAISSPDGIAQGARLFQARVTFVSNAATNLSPQLSALGFAWRR